MGNVWSVASAWASGRSVLSALLALSVASLLGCGDSGGESSEECGSLGCACELPTDCDAGLTCTGGLCGFGVSDAGEGDGGDEPDVTSDGGADAESDAEQDAAADVGGDTADATNDAAADAQVDAVEDVSDDAAVDAGTDVSTDAPTDVAADAVTDTGGDAEGDPLDDVSGDAGDDAGDAAADAEPDADVDPYPVVVPPLTDPWIAFDMQPDFASLAQVHVSSTRAGVIQLFDASDYLSSFAPTWSPDGRELAFVAFTLDARRVLVVYNVVTGSAAIYEPAGLSQFDNLAWAPAGNIIAMQSTTAEDADNEIYLYELGAEPTLTQVTDNDSADTFPRWSNEGRLYFATTGSGGLDVFSVDPFDPGSTPTQETFGADHRGKFGVSPDGSTFYYSRAADGTANLYVAAGASETLLSTGPADGDPYVARDGGSYVVANSREATVALVTYAAETNAVQATLIDSMQTPLRPCIAQVDSTTVDILSGE